MPKVYDKDGWKIEIRSRERTERFHVHARKGDKYCKYIVYRYPPKIELDVSVNMRSKDKMHVKKIISTNIDEFFEVWVVNQDHRGPIGPSS